MAGAMYTEQNAILVLWNEKIQENKRWMQAEWGSVRKQRQPRLTREVAFLQTAASSPELLGQPKLLLASRSSPSLASGGTAEAGFLPPSTGLALLLSCIFPPAAVPAARLPFVEAAGRMASCCMLHQGQGAARRSPCWGLRAARRHHDLSRGTDHSCRKPDA